MAKKNWLDWTAWILVIIGAINWGLYGLSPSYDLVNLIFGSISWLATLVYILVGLAGLYMLYYIFKK
ncbi:MAG: DUF378 domain-containing protein [Nanoarchaeota archaeon]|nr:DUF378 domain-containing protein [Nanoarchaeota archaeon]